MKKHPINDGPYSQRDNPGIGVLVARILWKWGTSNTRTFPFLMKNAWHLWRSGLIRNKQSGLLKAHLPTVIAISPTMRCNYNCLGCYSRDRDCRDELTIEELGLLLREAEQLGISAVVVTGGEPFIQEDMVNLIENHPRLLFVPITNGSLITKDTARRLARSGNNIVLVSLEGSPADTDVRRGKGAYSRVEQAFANLREARACFGFAATNTRLNSDYLSSRVFIDKMIDYGCMTGFYSEYVPSGPRIEEDWALTEADRAVFRSKVLTIRRTMPIVLVQFPQDEYGEDNICSAAGQASLHINSQGYVEPCPFVPVAVDNIRSGGLLSACRSDFLCSIRKEPELLKREKYACALFEHLPEIQSLCHGFKAEQTFTHNK